MHSCIFLTPGKYHGIWNLVKLARDLTSPGPPNGGLVREIPLFQGNLGW